MSQLFRMVVDSDRLTDELYAFVTDPRGSRGERPVIQELHDIAPQMVPVLEHMVLDGVDERGMVADYVRAVFGGSGTDDRIEEHEHHAV